MRTRGVLIVDNDPKINTVIASWLSQDGVPAVIVSTTREGLSSIALRQPAAIIVDLHLLDPTTIEFCQMLRQSPLTAKIPILIITGAHPEDVKEAHQKLQESGSTSTPVDYLTKPFSMDELYNALSALLGSREWIKGHNEPKISNAITINKSNTQG